MTFIRFATERDRRAVLAMAERFIRESSYRELITANPAQLERLVDYLITHDKSAIFLLMHGDASTPDVGDVVGMLAVSAFEDTLSGELKASEAAWWVDPEHRGGTGAIRMLLAAEAWAATVGAVRFEMLAPAGSTIGKLYTRRGYVEAETVYQRLVA